MSEQPKKYSIREEYYNVFIHLLGAVLALGGLVVLLPCAEKLGGGFTALFPAFFYWLSMLFMFSASTLYHWVQKSELKALLRQFDHSAIYLLITGTYAPLIFWYVRDRSGYIIFALLVLASVAGIAGKIIFKQKFHRIEVALYLLMGWCCVFIAPSMLRSMQTEALWLLLAGGIAYSGGVIFYVMRREFAHSLWHCAVFIGAFLHYMAVTFAFLD